MKPFFQFLVLLTTGFFVNLLFPFWSVAIVAFFISMLFKLNGWVSFITGFIAIFLLWVIEAYYIDRETASLLTAKIAVIFSVSSTMLLFITGIIGGLLGGFAASTGSLFRALFR